MDQQYRKLKMDAAKADIKMGWNFTPKGRIRKEEILR